MITVNFAGFWNPNLSVACSLGIPLLAELLLRLRRQVPQVVPQKGHQSNRSSICRQTVQQTAKNMADLA
jgi:hypothetical protein